MRNHTSQICRGGGVWELLYCWASWKALYLSVKSHKTFRWCVTFILTLRFVVSKLVAKNWLACFFIWTPRQKENDNRKENGKKKRFRNKDNTTKKTTANMSPTYRSEKHEERNKLKGQTKDCHWLSPLRQTKAGSWSQQWQPESQSWWVWPLLICFNTKFGGHRWKCELMQNDQAVFFWVQSQF